MRRRRGGHASYKNTGQMPQPPVERNRGTALKRTWSDDPSMQYSSSARCLRFAMFHLVLSLFGAKVVSSRPQVVGIQKASQTAVDHSRHHRCPSTWGAIAEADFSPKRIPDASVSNRSRAKREERDGSAVGLSLSGGIAGGDCEASKHNCLSPWIATRSSGRESSPVQACSNLSIPHLLVKACTGDRAVLA